MADSPRRRYSRSPSYSRGHPKARSRSQSLARSQSRSPVPNPRSQARSRSRSHEREEDAVNRGNTLYVTGLSSRVTERDVKDYFSKHGRVVGCHVVLEPHTRVSRGFAFVTMDTVEEAERCIKYLNDSVMEGRNITVEKEILRKLCSATKMLSSPIPTLPHMARSVDGPKGGTRGGDHRGVALGLGFQRLPSISSASRRANAWEIRLMSSDPSPHLPSPVVPPGAVEVDPLPQPAEPPEVMHRTRAVDFLGRRTPIVYQNDNGPCPLLAICNVLLLKNVISLNPDAGEVSQQKLLSLVAECLIDPSISVQDKDEGYVRNWKQNVADAIDLLPRLATGIDVNVMFRKIDDFEFTRERAIFDLLDIPLYHGWIVDPQDTETDAAIGSKSYNALASGLAEFKSGKPTEENKHVEEETVDFAAATTAALKIPSLNVSRGRSFDELTLSNSTEPHKRRGDLEEEEELMRVLNLSKAESGDAVDGEVSFDLTHSHSWSNMETPQSESFQLEAPEVVGAAKKEEHGDHAVSDDGSMLTNGAVNGSEDVPEESQETLTSREPEDSEIKNMLPGDLVIPVQSSESTPSLSHESFATSEHQPAVPTLVEGDKETCREQIDVQIRGQSNDTEVACDSSVATCGAVPGHATTELDVKSDSLDNSEPLPSSIQECEPIYQGEEHILGTTNMVYENHEPVYEGEVVLAEQADKTVESSPSMDDKATEHQWELIDNFLQTTANQLTVYGLFCLQEGLNESELCVFFRNNHFNTMFKYNGSLYLLATDQGFISQTDLVWQRLDEVNGDGVFLTSNFTPFKAETPRNDSWNEQQAMMSTADYLAQFDNSTSGNSDVELAIALQQQEFERQPQRFQAPPPQQQQQQKQPPQHPTDDITGFGRDPAISRVAFSLSKPQTAEAELDLKPSAPPLTYSEGDGSMPDSCLVSTTSGRKLNFDDVKMRFLKWYENGDCCGLVKEIMASDFEFDSVGWYCRENFCLFVELERYNKYKIRRTYGKYKWKDKNDTTYEDGVFEIGKYQLQKKVGKDKYIDVESMQMKEYRKKGGSKLRALWRFFIKEHDIRTNVNTQAKFSEEDVHQLKRLYEEQIEQIKSKAKETEEQQTNKIKQLEYLLVQSNKKVEEVTIAFHEVFAENQKLFNEVQDYKGNIRVFCRVRPFCPDQDKKSISIDIRENGLRILNPFLQKKEIFKFSKVFNEFATQAEVYCNIQPLIRSVLDGFNVCIFAYGQTGSGKTYTMTGPKHDWGVNYRALNDLFGMSQRRRDVYKYEIGVQMIEIYNEQVCDLLSNDIAHKNLEIRSTTHQNGLLVPDAVFQLVESASDLLYVMKAGQANRAVGSTALNEQSSRSHSVLIVHVRGLNLRNGSISMGNLLLVDLAGSERVEKSKVTGVRLKEAQNINRSLSALGDVIFALSKNNPHVPYRNSKLTHLLQSSLGGSAKTLMFTHINLDADLYLETLNTLKFARRVSGVELGASRSNQVYASDEGETENRNSAAEMTAEWDTATIAKSRQASMSRSKSKYAKTPSNIKAPSRFGGGYSARGAKRWP